MSLVGNVYRTIRADQTVREFVVLRENGQSITVDNVEPPHKARKIRRDRLENPRQYALVGHVKEETAEVYHWTPPPKFDSTGFADWLTRFMEAEDISAVELAERAGLSVTMVQTFRNGKPTNAARAKGQTELSPSLNTIAAIAHGLGMQFSYVAAKAGIEPTSNGRWANFTEIECLALAIALDPHHEGEDVQLDDLLSEFIAPQTKEKV